MEHGGCIIRHRHLLRVATLPTFVLDPLILLLIKLSLRIIDIGSRGRGIVTSTGVTPGNSRCVDFIKHELILSLAARGLEYVVRRVWWRMNAGTQVALTWQSVLDWAVDLDIVLVVGVYIR